MQTELDKLLKRNIEGYRGYSLAAEDIKNENFKNFLEAYAEKRKTFVEEIKQAMRKRDIEPAEKTSFLGDLHRAFMKIRETVSSNKDRAILEECARGESLALSDYEKALKSNGLTTEVVDMVMNQRDHIMAAEQTMRKLAPVLDEEK